MPPLTIFNHSEMPHFLGDLMRVFLLTEGSQNLGSSGIREYENMRIREYAYTSIHCIQYEVKVSAQVSSTGWEKQRWLVAIKFNILKGQNGKNEK